MKIALAALAATALMPATAAVADQALIDRGAYLARIMDCAGCHMPRDQTGMPIESAGLSGGTVGFEIPGLGIFWPPNLTPDDSGIGGWTAADIRTALTTGVRPDGRALAPAMPWPSYAGLAPEDMDALAAFLLSQQPVAAPRFDPVADAADAKAPFYRVTLPN